MSGADAASVDLVIVTGLSGAGKSIALNALADVGYYCVDNLPVSLLRALVDALRGAGHTHIAVGVDAREQRGVSEIAPALAALEQDAVRVQSLFLAATEACLMRRFSETRRLHPLGVLPQALKAERALLEPLRDIATELIETSDLSSRQLRTLVKDRFAARGRLNVVLTSFGFKYGALAGAELLFDARFLTNPYGVPELRPLTGFDDEVYRFVMDQPDARRLAELIETHLRFQVPRTLREGRAYLNVGIGCTGGQHRSVSLVRTLAEQLTRDPIDADEVVTLHLHHRDVGRVLG